METLAELCEEFFALSLEAEPFAATVLGFHEYDAAVPDVTLAGEADMRARLVDVQQRAAALAGSNVQGQDEVSRAMLETMAGHAIESIDAKGVEYTVTPFWFGAQAQVLTWLPKTRLDSADQAQAYVERVAKLDRFLVDSAARLHEGLQGGLTPVAAGVAGSLSQIDEYLAMDLDADPLLEAVRSAADSVVTPELRDHAEALIRDQVRPAMTAFRTVLADEIGPHARSDEQPGLAWLPDGEARYAIAIRQHTTTERSAQELHDLGLREIARLEDEYRELGGRVLGTNDLAEIYRRLREDPALRFDNPAAVVASAEAAIERARAALPDWFGHLPQAPCEVRAIPEMEARGSTIAYYTPPPDDGSGPGTYWVNTTTAASVYESEAVAFHETLPGHHLQIELAQRLEGLPAFRRHAGVTAYVEGWGLYTERLADEMGLYSSDLMRMGMLSLDSLRAGRLVVDTGLHALGWSRAKAVEFLVDNSAQDPGVMEAEVERYISYPGQALGYMVGRIELLRMRTDAQARMGSAFDIRGFHDVVLGSGAVPLNVLEDLVTNWSTAPPS